MKNKGIIIIGAGGHGKVLLDILLASKKIVAGFVDDSVPVGTIVNGYKVLGKIDYLKSGMSAVLGIGNNSIRAKLYENCLAKGVKVVTAIHPRSIISKFTKVGTGSVVMPGAVINANVVIGVGSVINTSASVDHDCRINDFCQIWPGAHLAGGIEVGEYTYIGTGANVIPYKKIGKNVIVGAGAVIHRDVPDNCTVVGVPMRIIKKSR